MFEYIFSQIVSEIRNQVQAVSGAEQQESVLNAWRPLLKERMRQLEKELKANAAQYASDDFDQTEDNQKESHDKFSFCYFLIEDFIDEQVADVTGKSLASVVSSSTSKSGPVGDQGTSSQVSSNPESVSSSPAPFKWTGTKSGIIELVNYLSLVANGSASVAPAPEDIAVVASMFVDAKGKPFPEKFFIPKSKPATQMALTAQKASAKKSAKPKKNAPKSATTSKSSRTKKSASGGRQKPTARKKTAPRKAASSGKTRLKRAAVKTRRSKAVPKKSGAPRKKK